MDGSRARDLDYAPLLVIYSGSTGHLFHCFTRSRLTCFSVFKTLRFCGEDKRATKLSVYDVTRAGVVLSSAAFGFLLVPMCEKVTRLGRVSVTERHQVTRWRQTAPGTLEWLGALFKKPHGKIGLLTLGSEPAAV